MAWLDKLPNPRAYLKTFFKWTLLGLLLGLLTALFRVFGTAAEGVSYAIVIGNTLVPLIEKVTIPRAFGKRGAAR